MELIRVVNQDTIGRLLINAMAAAVHPSDIVNTFAPKDGSVQVELKINGTVVPVVQVLVEAWERLSQSYRDDVETKARELVTRAGLEKIADAVASATERIEEVFKEAEDDLVDAIREAEELPDPESLQYIPQAEAGNVLNAFWYTLREMEARAHDENDPLHKHMVEGYYRLWNRITNGDKKARWEE